MRSPNSTCVNCGGTTYRRPNEIAKYAHVEYRCRKCRALAVNVVCPQCGGQFDQTEDRKKYCSRACANRGRRGIHYRKSHSNHSRERLARLQERFGFTTCMVEGCTYCTTFDIHRVTPGSQGGRYEIGNMFAICPNHHAEATRKLIVLEKVVTIRFG